MRNHCADFYCSFSTFFSLLWCSRHRCYWLMRSNEPNRKAGSIKPQLNWSLCVIKNDLFWRFALGDKISFFLIKLLWADEVETWHFLEIINLTEFLNWILIMMRFRLLGLLWLAKLWRVKFAFSIKFSLSLSFIEVFGVKFLIILAFQWNFYRF